MEDLWKRIEIWLAENAPHLRQTFAPPATEAEIAATEQTLGIVFPEDVRVWYGFYNGRVEETDGNLPTDMLSLRSLVENWASWKTLLEAGTFTQVQARVQAGKGIAADWWNVGWIPLTDSSSDHFCLDMAPAEGGTVGQIIATYHDEGVRSLEAENFREWVADFVTGLEEGEYVYDEEQYGDIVSADDVF